MSLGHQVFLFFLYVLVNARITRLINWDMILDKPRLIPHRKLREARDAQREAHRLGQVTRAEILGRPIRRWFVVTEFLECAWCVGFWVALADAIVLVRLYDWPWWAIFPVSLAASHLIGVFAFASHTEETTVVETTA